MGIDVVGTVLRIVLNDKDGGLSPQRTVAYRIDEFSKSEVIARNAGLGGEGPRSGSIGVVFSETHDDELRHVSLLDELLILSKHDLDQIHVSFASFPTGADTEVRTHVSDESWNFSFHQHVSLSVRGAFAVLFVGSIADPSPLAGIPYIS